MAAPTSGFVDVTAECDVGDLQKQTASFFGIEEVLQTLSFVLEVVAEFQLVHGVVLIATFWNGLSAAPAVVAHIEYGRLPWSPFTGLPDELVQVLEGGVRLDEEFDGEVLNFG